MNCVARAYPNTFAARLKSRAFPASEAIQKMSWARGATKAGANREFDYDYEHDYEHEHELSDAWFLRLR